MGANATANRSDVVWSLVAPIEGVSIDAKTGAITVAESVALGTEITVKATVRLLGTESVTKTFTIIDAITVDRTDLVTDVDLSNEDNLIIKLSDLVPELTNNTGASVTFGNGDAITFTLSGNDSIAIAKSSLANYKGETTIVVKCAGYAVTTKLCVCTKIFTQADAANFESIIEANLDGYFILGSDIDFTGVAVKTIGDTADGGSADKYLKFTFDGRGYAMTNIVVVVDNPTRDPEKNGSLFGRLESGSFSNVMIEMETYAYYWGSGTRLNATALFQCLRKAASVDNVYLVIRHPVDGTGKNAYEYQAGIAEMCLGSITNCVVDIDVADVDSVSYTAWLVGYDYWENPYTNNYAITNGLEMKFTISSSAPASYHGKNEAYLDYDAFYASVTELPAADGWSSYWSLENGTLSFGGKTVNDI